MLAIGVILPLFIIAVGALELASNSAAWTRSSCPTLPPRAAWR